MRRLVAALCGLALFGTAVPANAEGLNNLYAGVNSLLNVPLEIPMHLYEPPDDFEDFIGVPVTNRVIGLFSGSLATVHRAGMAIFDIVLTPFWVFPTMSPEPYYEAISDVEYVE